MTWAITAEQLLSEATWLRRLAERLADDRGEVDDLVQDTQIAAWQRNPDTDRPLRPWLAKVMRDAARMRRRSRARRATRDAASLECAEVATPEELMAQAQLHRLLVDLVLELKEPYRTTVLARFVEGRSAADIARTSGVPEGTIRWRLSEALRQLRDQLDARADKRTWAGLGAPAMWMSKAKAAVVVAGIIVILLLSIVAGRRLGGPSNTPEGPIAPTTPGAPTTAHAGRRGDDAQRSPNWLIPANRSVHQIVGRVVREDGVPIAGAAVGLQSFATAVHGEEEAQMVTGPDGAFRFTPRWAARYILTATAEERAPASIWVDPRGPSDAADPERLVLVLRDCAQSAEGTIADAGGGVIVGATIRRLPTGVPGQFGVSTKTGKDGRYKLCLARGTNWLDIGAEGYEHVLREVDARARLRVDVGLVPGATVTGQVVDASTGRSIAGVHVAMWPTTRRSGEASDRAAVSDADGRFTVDGLAAGRYQVTAWDLDHTRTVIDEVAVEADLPNPPLRVRMDPGVEVRGVVKSEGSPVGGARVVLSMTSVAALRHFGGTTASTFDVVTDPDGAFSLRGVPIAASLIPQVTGYSVRTPAAIDTRSAINRLAIEVSPLAALHGRVVRDGLAVPDAEVSALGPTSLRLTTRSDGRGEFRIAGVAPGTYEVHAVSETRGAFSTKPLSTAVPTDADLVIELDGGAVIDGVVIDETGAPLASARVSAVRRGGDDRGTAVTGIDGRFSVDSLAGGDYSLTVSSAAGDGRPLTWVGAAPSAVTLENGHAHAGPVSLSVRRNESTISGLVLDPGGAPVSDAIVRLGPLRGGVARTTTDGRFHLVVSGSGPFTIDAGIGTGPRAELTNVAAGSTDLILKLIRPGTIRGTLVGLTDAHIWVRRVAANGGIASPQDTRSLQADGETFVCDGLVPGIYIITAMTTSRPTATARIQVDEGAIVPVTLTADVSRAIVGRVTRIGDGAPMAGVTCAAAEAAGDLLPAGLQSTGTTRATTDSAGQFSIDGAPAGEAVIICFGTSRSSSGATVVKPGGSAQVEVVALPEREPGRWGIELNRHRLSSVVLSVSGDAVSAEVMPGDRIVAVDGVNVASLYVDAVYWLIAGRPYGSTVALTFERGGKSNVRTVTVGPPGIP